MLDSETHALYGNNFLSAYGWGYPESPRGRRYSAKERLVEVKGEAGRIEEGVLQPWCDSKAKSSISDITDVGEI